MIDKNKGWKESHTIYIYITWLTYQGILEYVDDLTYINCRYRRKKEFLSFIY